MHKFRLKKDRKEDEQAIVNASDFYDNLDQDPEDNEYRYFPEFKNRNQSREQTKYQVIDLLIFSPWMRLAYVVILCLFIGFLVPFFINLSYEFAPPVSTVPGTCHIREGVRTNCFPDTDSVTKEQCEARGCCYQELNVELGAPVCHHAIPSYHSLNLSGPAVDGTYSLYTSYPEKSWISDGKYSEPRLRVRQVAAGHAGLIFCNESQLNQIDLGTNSTLADIEVSVKNETLDLSTPDDRLKLRVYRKNERNNILFDSSYGSVVLGDTLSEISLLLRQPLIFGLGGHEASFIGNSSYTNKALYNLEPDEVDGLQHTQPIFIGMDIDRNFFGVYVESENPLEIDVLPGLNSTRLEPIVVFRSMGGYMILHVFSGPDVKTVLNQLITYIGKPKIPPKWAMGYHVCQATGNEQDFLDKIGNMTDQNIPYDTDCIDELLVQSAFKMSTADFIVSSNIAELEQNGKSILLRHPVALETQDPVPQYANGHYIKWNGSTDNFEGRFNGRLVVVPDFLHPDMPSWWLSGLDSLNSDQFENKIRGFTFVHNSPYVLPVLTRKCATPDYIPEEIRALYGKFTVCGEAEHHGGKDHLSQHNSFPMKQMEATQGGSYEYLFSQHSSPGLSQFGGVLLSHRQASWENMRRTLKEAVEFGMYGSPMVSMPGCGWVLSSDPIPDELCLRWFQLAAYMPAIHSYHDIHTRRIMPYDLAGAYRDWVRRALELRYRLMPYLYSIMFEAYKMGTPFIRPLFVEFPDDHYALDINEQFMIGDSILISPVLYFNESTTQIRAYFPSGKWYDLWSGQFVEGTSNWKFIEDIPYQIASHLKAGKIVPILEHSNQTLEESFNNKYSMIIALGCDVSPRFGIQKCEASGSMVLPSKLDASDPTLRILALSDPNDPDSGSVTLEVESAPWSECGIDYESGAFGGMILYGVRSQPNWVEVGGETQPVTTDIRSSTFYEPDLMRLQIGNITMNFCSDDPNFTTLRWYK